MRKAIIDLIHGLNAATAAGTAFTEAVPEEWKPWILVVNVLLGASLPSLRGIGHRITYGTDPATGEKKPMRLPGGLFILMAALVLFGFQPAIADEETTVEIAFGMTDISSDTLDSEEGEVYSFAINEPLGKLVSLNVRLERLDGFDDEDLGAYCVDAILRFNFGKPAARFYLGGGVGGVWTDNLTSTRTVEIEVVDDISASGNRHSTTSEVEATLEVEDEANFLRGDLVGGVRFYFGDSKRFGFGLQHEISKPLSEDVAVDDTSATTIYFITPIGKG
jgi:hypothetical protein